MAEIRIAYWSADQDLTGGSPCSHRHRTREAAERCLPAVPRSSGGTQHFSRARVHAIDANGHDITDALDHALQDMQAAEDDAAYERLHGSDED